jgi:hypothetical protein
MSLWRWAPGRQGGGYRKLLLARGRSWDAYVLDYPPGSGVSVHRDPVDGRRHYRLNVVLRGALDAFYVAHLASLERLTYRKVPARWSRRVRSALGGRVVLFRPDQTPHGVEPGTKRRVVLSVGWVRP